MDPGQVHAVLLVPLVVQEAQAACGLLLLVGEVQERHSGQEEVLGLQQPIAMGVGEV